MVNLERNLVSSRLAALLISLLMTMVYSQNVGAAAGGGDSLKCMALNLYFEARGEPTIGKIAVGNVTLNRAGSKFFQKTVCGVVYAKSQFSWTFDKYSDVPKPGPIWNESIAIAKQVLARVHPDPTGHASHYCNPAKLKGKMPKWTRVFRQTAVIGDHVFYQMQGFVSSPVAKNGKPNKKVGWDSEEELGQFYEMGADYLTMIAEEAGSSGEVVHPFEDYSQFMSFIDSLPDAEGMDDGFQNMDYQPEEGSQLPQTWNL